MTDEFLRCMEVIWRPDFDGVDNDRAPGETFYTRWGITEMTWAGAVGQEIVKGRLETASMDDLRAIFRANYWKPCGCDRLEPGVDLMVFNAAIVTGARRAARQLQRVVGADQDGVVGPATAAKAAGFPVKSLISWLYNADCAYYQSLGKPQFINGWLRREGIVRDLAVEWAA